MSADLSAPDYARRMRLIAQHDQGGRADGVQIMVQRGHAYVGHMFSQGFSVIDVRDPARPVTVAHIQAPPNTWNIHLQAHDDLMLVVNARDMFAAAEFQDERAYYSGSIGAKTGIATMGDTDARNWTAGMTVYDVSRPAEPRQIGFLPIEGGGVHRIWYTGGRWAYVSALLNGFSDYILLTIDMADSTQPREAGRFWLPGMNVAAGETPPWPDTRRCGLHHAIVHGETAYAAWRDAGMAIVDVSDRAAPRLLTHRNCRPRSAAARIIAYLCPIATCWSWSTRRCSTIRRTGSNSSGSWTSASLPIRSVSRRSRRPPKRTT